MSILLELHPDLWSDPEIRMRNERTLRLDRERRAQKRAARRRQKQAL